MTARAIFLARLSIVLAFIAIAFIVAWATAAKAEEAKVKIDNFTFDPPVLKVKSGTTVTWVNQDDIPHALVNMDKVFKSKVLDTGDKFSFTFAKAGTYPYFCSLHPKMTGAVVVQ